MEEIDLTRRNLLTTLAALPSGGTWIWKGPIRSPEPGSEPAPQPKTEPASTPAPANAAPDTDTDPAPEPTVSIRPDPTAAESAITTVRVRNTGAALTGARLSFGLPLQRGDLPTGSRIELRSADGKKAYPTQQDQEASWPDGKSLTYVAVSAVLPDSLAADEVRTLQVWRKAAPPARKPNVTLAQVAQASDFKIVCTGGDFGADVLQASVNDIIANGRDAGAANGWGKNPAMGYEVVRSGPLVSEWRLWAWLKRAGDGARHKHLKAVFWLRAWGGDVYQIMGQVVMPNAYGTAPGATLGSNGAHKLVYTARLMSGSNVIRHIGGRDDPRTSTFPASNVDTPKSQIDFGAGSRFDSGMPVQFETTGTLPGGLSAGTSYWVKWRAPHVFTIHKNRVDARKAENAVKLTSQGSGMHTAIPMVSSHWRQGWWTCGTDSLPDWVGTKQSELLVAHNAAYLTRKTRAVPPYRLAPLIQPYRGYVRPYYPNTEISEIQRSLQSTGDGTDDQRIGLLSNAEVNALVYQPLDLPMRRFARNLANWAPDFGLYYEDPETGRLMCVGSRNYPGLGTSKKDYRAGQPGTPYGGSPPRPDINWWDGTGATSGYGNELEASHLPNHWYGQYLLSGDRWHWEAGAAIATANFNSSARSQNWNGDFPPYSNVMIGPRNDQQLRGVGWLLRTTSLARHVAPDGDPLKPFLHDAVADSMQCWADLYAGGPISEIERKLGIVPTANDILFSFQHGFFSQAMGMLRWMGYYPVVETVWTTLRKACLNVLDSDTPVDESTRGCLSFISVYFLYCGKSVYGQKGPMWKTAKQMFDWHASTGGGKMKPGIDTTFVCHQSSSTDNAANSYTAVQRSALALHAMAGDAQALKLYKRLNGMQGFSPNFNGSARYAIEVP